MLPTEMDFTQLTPANGMDQNKTYIPIEQHRISYTGGSASTPNPLLYAF